MALEASIIRQEDGAIGLRLVPRERSILRALVGDLRELIGEETPAPGIEEADEPDGAEVESFEAVLDAAAAASNADDAADDAAADADGDAGAPAGEGIAAPPDAGWTDDPAIARLYPDARPDDPAWSATFRGMTRGDLDDARRANLAVVDATIDARTIDDAQAGAWLHVLNDLRLVMGARLGVTEDDQGEPLDPEDPDAAARIVFAYVGWLEEQLVDVLADTLPPVPGDDDDPDEGVTDDDS